ncbi:acetylglucosamine-6-sulfatase [Vibrio sp. HA2012]|uniref:sulfatase family protein n=1 Tax=Vibrio sp. HA2012 TaxID=1971595 RepID=UPI000C2BF33B|nr:sulfatase [Vibrio sp. HA2012]PJC86632.1 acetylglucosamine-6-sulfatase [Vibrio sp. HA2012]
MKKKFLSSLVAVACAPAIFVGSAQAAASADAASTSHAKPNIVYIIVDDQRYDALGFMNDAAVTPNMDKMAANGVHFKNAFVTSSLSSPSRASVLTGLYSHNHGISDNNPNPVAEKLKYFPQELHKAGYQTGFFGKWHFGGIEEKAKAGFAGFDRWVGLIGQGDYYPVNMMGKPAQLNIDGKMVNQKGYITDELTDYALDYLDHRDKDKPFMIYLSHKGVHADFLPAPRHIDTLKGKKFPVPASYADTEENYKGKPRWVKDQRNSWHGVDFPYMKDLDLNKFQRDYYETLRSVDDSVGRVQKYLKDHNLADNTIIMLMGDNGFQFGEHGLTDKRTAYEASIRVPLIASGPGFDKGRVVEDVVANIDIAPTLLDAAGVKTPDWYDGSSFYPLAHGEKPAKPRDSSFVYEYFWEYNFPYTPTTFAVRNDTYKYIQYYGLWETEELYNLKDDPDEMHNLINSKDDNIIETKIALRKELFEKLKDHNGNNVIPYNQRRSEGVVQRHGPEGRKAANFPKEWMKEYGTQDFLMGWFPDRLNKKEFYKQFETGLKKGKEALEKAIEEEKAKSL